MECITVNESFGRRKKEFLIEFSEIAVCEELHNNPSIKMLKGFVNAHKKHFDCVPRKLYKYRRFDKSGYTYKSIIDDRYYLSNAGGLDDVFEASLKSGFKEYHSDNSFFDRIFLYCMHKITQHYKKDDIPIDQFYFESKKHLDGGPTLFLGKVIEYLKDDMESNSQVLDVIVNCVLCLKS